MWFEDLAEWDFWGRKDSKRFFGEDYSTLSTTVGWLEKGKPYTTGKAPNTLVEKLSEFIKTWKITNAYLGIHECDLCEVDLPPGHLNIIDGLGSRTTFIAYKDKLYIFPDLIIHYIKDHSYLPPAEFIEAALDSTPQETVEYFMRIHKNRVIRKNLKK